MVVSASMFAHAHATVEIMKAIIQDPPLLFIAGLMGVTAGLAIILAHNVWSGGALPIIVTLFGWVSLIKGTLLLTLSPEAESRVFIVGGEALCFVRFISCPTPNETCNVREYRASGRREQSS
jgi:hypothetical protein